MRWTYLLPRVILVGLVWAFFRFGFDPILRRGLIDASQRAARAKVEIDGLETTFFAPTLKAAGIRVADRKHPGTNLVEFAELHAKLEGVPLLKKSFVVEEATVRGLKWGTPRADSGLLPDEEPEQGDDADSPLLENIKHELLARGKDWLAGLADRAKLDFDPNQFETVRLGDELEEHWPKEFQRYQEQLQTLKQRIDELRKSVKVKGGNELEKIERYGRAAHEVERLLEELDQVKQKLALTMQQARDDLQALEDAKARDLAKIKQKTDLLHLDPNEITEFLLGPELTHRLETAIGWARFIRERVELATDEPKPERFRGETYVFPRQQELPAMLIRLLHVDGEGEFSGERLAFKGSISGITSHPKIHGKPIIVHLDAVGMPVGQRHPTEPSRDTTSATGQIELVSSQSAKADPVTVRLKAVLDYTNDVPEQQFVLSYKEPQPEPQDFGKPESIQLAMTSRAIDCRADLMLVGDRLSGQIDYQQALEAITAKLGSKRFKNDQRVLAVIQDVVSGIRKIDAQMQLSGTVLKPQFKLRSNLGRELSSGLNTAFARQLETGRQELLVRFDQEAAKRSEKLTQLYDEQLEKLTGQLSLNRGELQELAQIFGLKLPGKLDVKGLGGLPIDPRKPMDSKKPLELPGVDKVLPKPDVKLPKFGLQPERESSSTVRPSTALESTIEDLGSLFQTKKKPAPKPVPPAAGQQPRSQ